MDPLSSVCLLLLLFSIFSLNLNRMDRAYVLLLAHFVESGIKTGFFPRSWNLFCRLLPSTNFVRDGNPILIRFTGVSFASSIFHQFSFHHCDSVASTFSLSFQSMFSLASSIFLIHIN